MKTALSQFYREKNTSNDWTWWLNKTFISDPAGFFYLNIFTVLAVTWQFPCLTASKHNSPSIGTSLYRLWTWKACNKLNCLLEISVTKNCIEMMMHHCCLVIIYLEYLKDLKSSSQEKSYFTYETYFVKYKYWIISYTWS